MDLAYVGDVLFSWLEDNDLQLSGCSYGDNPII